MVYIWEIQQRRANSAVQQHRTSLLNLAERCHTHLAHATATNSPSRRYAVILEEFRKTALCQTVAQERNDEADVAEPPGLTFRPQNPTFIPGNMAPDTIGGGLQGSASLMNFDPQQFDAWQMTDFFIDLDSSVSTRHHPH